MMKKLRQARLYNILLYNCEIWGVDLLEKKTSSHFLSGQKHMLPCEKLEIKMLKYSVSVAIVNKINIHDWPYLHSDLLDQ